MSLNDTIIEKLKMFSNVPVYLGERETMTTESISISPVKLDELVGMYEKIYAFTHTIWRNLPNPPDCEPAFVIIWMISSNDYDVNHLTVSWTGSSANVFVHLWSTIDRLRSSIDSMTSYWLFGSRGPVGYAEFTNMPGAADVYLYPKEIIKPPHIEVLSAEMDMATVTDLNTDYESFYEFRRSLMMRKKMPVIDVSAMLMRTMDTMTTNASGSK